jgi:flagellar motility protein MotE (MotC chaperone)
LETARKQREDSSWQGMVKLYESMKPRDAAKIFNDLPMPVLLQLVDRMKNAKAGAVLADMNADRARDLTTQLAHMRTERDRPADITAPVSADAARKGPADKGTSQAGG